ncbi:MAG: radical SAM protein [Kiritimatiellae bacterium]|nr:radical SAM protein [Kiritimatiellia bacterium]
MGFMTTTRKTTGTNTTSPSSPRWSLAPGVYYRLAGENVYVRNVTTRYDYLFNPMVKDILDLLRVERTKDELLEELGKTYALKKSPDFGDKLDKFLENLTRKEVLRVKMPTSAPVAVPPVSTDGKPKLSDAEGRAKGWYQKNHRLWNACFELTYLCNEKCRHCYLDDPKANAETGILRFDVWKKVIDEIADMGCMNILVTGGEPTLHPDFLQICQHIVDRGMLLDIFTNALNISDELFDSIVALHPNTVSFSLYGGTPEFHDWITQVPGSFERSLKTIMMFKCAGVNLYVKSVLFKGHAEEFAKLRKWGKRAKIQVNCAQVVSDGRAGSDHTGLNADDATLTQYLETVADEEPFWQQSEIPLRKPDDTICGMGLYTLTVRPNGNISPCIPHPMVLGNVTKDSLPDIWDNSLELNKLRQYRWRDVSAKCVTCEHSGFCMVCPGTSYAECGELAPCSYSCRHAQLKHNLFLSGRLRHA